jgi:hypothetical protein
VGEVDAKPEASWPYEVLMPFLDVNRERGGGLVFVLAGSSGGMIGEFKERIAAAEGGRSAQPRAEANEWEIPPMVAGDRILVALSQMLDAASVASRLGPGLRAPHVCEAGAHDRESTRAVVLG